MWGIICNMSFSFDVQSTCLITYQIIGGSVSQVYYRIVVLISGWPGDRTISFILNHRAARRKVRSRNIPNSGHCHISPSESVTSNCIWMRRPGCTLVCCTDRVTLTLVGCLITITVSVLGLAYFQMELAVKQWTKLSLRKHKSLVGTAAILYS